MVADNRWLLNKGGCLGRFDYTTEIRPLIETSFKMSLVCYKQKIKTCWKKSGQTQCCSLQDIKAKLTDLVSGTAV